MNLKLLENKIQKDFVPVFSRVYFLPNHDRQWIKNILRIVKQSSRLLAGSRILVIGYYYASIIKSNFINSKVTAIDVDPLGLLSNAFAIWLKLYKKLKFQKIFKILFFDFYTPGKENTRKLPRARYIKSLSFFKEFLRLQLPKVANNQTLAEYLFKLIYRITSCDKFLILDQMPKGICADIIKYPLRAVPDEIIAANIMELNSIPKYQFISLNNSIDFVKNKKSFLHKVKSLLLDNGVAEISSYNIETQKILKNCYNKRIFLGTGVFYKRNKNGPQYSKKSIYLNEISYIFKKIDI